MFDVTTYLKELGRDERGLTALETAIILIAFIVAASVFAFTILSAGTFSTERGKEAVYSGLGEVQSSIAIEGSVIATASSTGTAATVDELIFTVRNVIGGEPIDLGQRNGARFLIVNYRDAGQAVKDLSWSLAWIVRRDADDLLEAGELAEITVPLTAPDPLATALGVNTSFDLELIPPKGATILLRRTTPPSLDLITDLH
ncbi:MAG: archaellin/type IV pilin N-terminal domain-containing protein [Chloroflexota bacterium]